MRPSVFLISLLVAFMVWSCKQESAGVSIRNLSGQYTGTASVEERILRDGVTIYDTSFTLSDEVLRVTEIGIDSQHYQVELVTQYKVPSGGTVGDLWHKTEMYFYESGNGDLMNQWGYDSYGYTVDSKHNFRFPGESQAVTVKLEHYPNGPTIIYDPDSPWVETRLEHFRVYQLEANR